MPVGTGVAVVVATIIGVSHATADGQSPGVPLLPRAAAHPSPSVLAFHTTKPSIRHSPARPVRDHQPHRHATAPHRAVPAFRIRTTAPCYVQVTNRDGKLLVRRILHRGDHLSFRQHGLHVVLGNAGGARISVDGHRPHAAGASGQVRRFRVG